MYCQWDANDNVMKSEKRVNLHGSMQDTLKKQMTNPTNSIFHYNNPEKAEIIHVYTLIPLHVYLTLHHCHAIYSDKKKEPARSKVEF